MASSHEEDHLTEFIAAALAVCEAFREAYCMFLLGAYTKRRGWDGIRIESISTQVSYPGADGEDRPDLVLDLLDGNGRPHRVLVEHKIFAKESRRTSRQREGSIGEPADEQMDGQLARYLRLNGVEGVAYVRSWPQALDRHILEQDNYIVPEQGMHFLWWHFYPILAATAECNPLVEWLREGFELDGRTPPRKDFGPLHFADDPERERAHRGEFAKLLELAAVRAAEAGWRPNFDQHGAELYLRKHPESWADRVLFSGIGKPKKARQIGFRVWVTPHAGRGAEALDRLHPVLHSTSLPRGLDLYQLPKQGETVELSTTLTALLEGAEDVDSVRKRFADVVGAFLACL